MLEKIKNVFNETKTLLKKDQNIFNKNCSTSFAECVGQGKNGGGQKVWAGGRCVEQSRDWEVTWGWRDSREAAWLLLVPLCV